MKNRKAWTRWFCARKGFVVAQWAEQWLDVLQAAGLPGEDYLLNACNTTMDAWLPRPAEYDDFRRALHFLLIKYANKSPEEAVGYAPHGFRHVLIVAGQQLRSQGVVDQEGLEALGHWEPGSRCPAATI